MERSHAETRQPGPGMLSWCHSGMHKLRCTNWETSARQTQPVVSPPPKRRPGCEGPGGSNTHGSKRPCPKARLPDEGAAVHQPLAKGLQYQRGLEKLNRVVRKGEESRRSYCSCFLATQLTHCHWKQRPFSQSLVLVLKV